MNTNTIYTNIPLQLKGKLDRLQSAQPDPETCFTDTKTEDQLYCVNCLASITSYDQRVSINSLHTHTFVNPAGLSFTIGCFSSSPGCTFHGEPTSLHSWFPGYLWNYADCSNCRNHLGWQFTDLNGNSCFSGLILDRLTDRSQVPGN